METLKKIYYYFFYKIYCSVEYTSELSGGKFLSAFKASLVMIALEIWSTVSILNFYNIIFNRYMNIPKSIYIGIVLLFSIISYFTFDYTDVWKSYNKKFDKLPKKKNILGGWIVFGFVLFIITNLVFSFYLMSQIDWSQYR